jgi:hypothetical protein
VVRILALSIVLAATTAAADEVTIQTDVALHRRATRRSATVLTLAAGESADAIAHRDGWIKLRVRGHTGWVPEASLIEILPDEPVPPPPQAPEVAEPEPIAPPPPPERRAAAAVVAVAAGLTVITQGVRAPDNNYNLGVTAATASLAGAYTHRLRDDLAITAEAAYAYHRSLPGIRATDPETGEAITTPFAVHDLDVQLALARATRGVVLIARAGVRTHRFAIAANPSQVPSELRVAPTLGAGLAIPRVAERLGLRFVLDTHLAGTYTDAMATARGAALQTTVSYRWKPGLDVRAGHEVDLSILDFGAAIARYDVVHMLTVGVAKDL